LALVVLGQFKAFGTPQTVATLLHWASRLLAVDEAVTTTAALVALVAPVVVAGVKTPALAAQAFLVKALTVVETPLQAPLAVAVVVKVLWAETRPLAATESLETAASVHKTHCALAPTSTTQVAVAELVLPAVL
jgi:hypothetical protein